jgi:predicted dinucleotide-binding enzyme
MKIGVFGTGIVGRTIAARLVELGHSVSMGTRSPADTLARSGPDPMGNEPVSAWLKQHPQIKLVPYAEAAREGEILVNATNGSGSLDALRAAGEGNLNGKILMDISNPLDFSRGMPPTLFISNTDSLGEQIQRTFANLKVVKTLNTMNAQLMVNPRSLADGNHTVFLSGNDAGAKETVTTLLRSFGWKDILDLGDIGTARGVEMYLPVWLRMWSALQIPSFQIKVVR